ncbi:hypothetical protein F5Y05DRAFT_261905 [Hypoxylon sp. FL0543]|nr:hypothetical protein F5Y05DRAFT_261905 [Hypoxylon sp. FL0543]
MHAKRALALVFASSTLASAQSSNPGGPIQSVSSAADQGTTGVLSIQTDTSVLSIQTNTVVSGSDSTVSPTASGSESVSATTVTSSSTETSAAVSSSVSPGGAPRETGYVVAAGAAIAAGFVGVVAAL